MKEGEKLATGDRVKSTVPGRWAGLCGTVRWTVPGVQYAISWDDGGPETLVTLGTAWADTVARGMDKVMGPPYGLGNAPAETGVAPDGAVELSCDELPQDFEPYEVK